jgi:sulfite reductase (ferredoxin)
MSNSREPILHLPQSVVDDVRNYRNGVKSFLEGETTAISFKAYRVPMGVYEQRAECKYMVRIRIGAGLVLPYQLQRIAELSKTYGNGIVHVTTRQDIQIHEVDIEKTSDVLEGLLEVGLAARGGGGNTVRNVTACPRANVCPQEEFDVAPYAIATAEYLLQSASSFNLPRKYKIVFSGCSVDCAYASVADLGFFAHKKDGVDGFAVYAAGGLGSHPRVGVKIEDFIQTDEALKVAEAIKRLFDKHGDRSNKHKARLRYVLNRLGTDEFVKLYRQERDDVAKQGLPGDVPEIRDIGSRFAESVSSVSSDSGPGSIRNNVMPEKVAGMFTIRLKLKLGDVPADDLIKIAKIADEFGQGIIRTTQLQDILISGVLGGNVEKAINALSELRIDVIGDNRPTIVACTGAATCKLGLCLSRGLADAIDKELQERDISTDASGPVIRISGCPNSCGHHHIADVGFEGKAKRINGRLMPFYDVLAASKVTEGDSHLAERIGSVPAKRIPQMMADAFTDAKIDKEQLATLVGRYGDVSSEPPDEYYYDFGSDELFSLAGRSPGECGVGVMDIIKVDIDEAKASLEQIGSASEIAKKNEATYKAIVSAARALLFVFGLEPKKDREIFTAFAEHLINPGWVKAQTTTDLIGAAMDWRLGERDSIGELSEQVKELLERVEELFGSLDANLKFRVAPVERKLTAETAQAVNYKADLRGVACPLNFVKAKLALEKVKPGEVLDVLLDNGESVRNVPDSFTEQGQKVLEVNKVDDYFLVRIQRKK